MLMERIKSITNSVKQVAAVFVLMLIDIARIRYLDI